MCPPSAFVLEGLEGAESSSRSWPVLFSSQTPPRHRQVRPVLSSCATSTPILGGKVDRIRAHLHTRLHALHVAFHDVHPGGPGFQSPGAAKIERQLHVAILEKQLRRITRQLCVRSINHWVLLGRNPPSWPLFAMPEIQAKKTLSFKLTLRIFAPRLTLIEKNAAQIACGDEAFERSWAAAWAACPN